MFLALCFKVTINVTLHNKTLFSDSEVLSKNKEFQTDLKSDKKKSLKSWCKKVVNRIAKEMQRRFSSFIYIFDRFWALYATFWKMLYLFWCLYIFSPVSAFSYLEAKRTVNGSQIVFLNSYLYFLNKVKTVLPYKCRLTPTLWILLSSEMDSAETRFIRKAFIKERGTRVFRKIRLSSILWEPFKDSAPPRHFVKMLAIQSAFPTREWN